MRHTVAALVTSVVVLPWWGLGAQAVPTAREDTATEAKTICFRGKPQSRCKLFSVLELAYNLGNAPHHDGISASIEFAYGLMFNFSERNAVGAVLVAGKDDETYSGTALRYRRWLNSNVGLDVTLGAVSEADTREDSKGFRPQANVGLMIGDVIGGSVVGLKEPEGMYVRAGPRVGSWVVLAMGVASLLVFALSGG